MGTIPCQQHKLELTVAETYSRLFQKSRWVFKPNLTLMNKFYSAPFLYLEFYFPTRNSQKPLSQKPMSPSRTVKLVLAGPPNSTTAAVDFFVASIDDGVDLGAIGRRLGVGPATVRLNGHLLSCGLCHVSSVTWASLLSFFAARGFPTGASDSHPIAVDGKPAAADLEDHLSFKRKITLEDESPAKKTRKSVNNSDIRKAVNGEVSDDEIISIGRRLKLDDNLPSKKPKISHCNTASEASILPRVPSRIGFAHNCISGLGKRSREEEMVVPVSCKRIK